MSFNHFPLVLRVQPNSNLGLISINTLIDADMSITRCYLSNYNLYDAARHHVDSHDVILSLNRSEITH